MKAPERKKLQQRLKKLDREISSLEQLASLFTPGGWSQRDTQEKIKVHRKERDEIQDMLIQG